MYAASRPNVVGLSLDEATARLRRLGFSLGQVTVRRTNEAPARQVLSQAPEPESELDVDTPVSLTYAEPLSPTVRLPAPVPNSPACGSTIERPSNKNLVFGWNLVNGATL